MKERLLWMMYALLGRRFGDIILMKIMNLTRRDKRIKKIIKHNKKFNNIHKGERCFILGNGPSLREVDLGLLENEFVFTCNFFGKRL